MNFHWQKLKFELSRLISLQKKEQKGKEDNSNNSSDGI